MAKSLDQPFTKEAKQLNELAKARETSYRNFCVAVAKLQQQVIDAGIVFKWWARDNLINPRTNSAWATGTLHAYVQLGRKSDAEWQQIRARKNVRRAESGIINRPINEQVDVLLLTWQQVSVEAQQIFLDQVTPNRRLVA